MNIKNIDQLIRSNPDLVGGVAGGTQKGGMTVLIDMCMDELSSAEKEFEKLSDQLRPIRADRPVPNGQEVPIPAAACEMEDRILSIAHRVMSLRSQIKQIQHQLCV